MTSLIISIKSRHFVFPLRKNKMTTLDGNEIDENFFLKFKF